MCRACATYSAAPIEELGFCDARISASASLLRVANFSCSLLSSGPSHMRTTSRSEMYLPMSFPSGTTAFGVSLGGERRPAPHVTYLGPTTRS